MAKKITQLPTASLVRPQDYVPIVDVNDVQTEKATLSQVVTGLNSLVATLTGSNFSGPVIGTGGLSGSLTKLSTGVSYLVAGANTFITTASNGQVTITATGGSAAAGGGPGEVQYNQASALQGIAGFTYDGTQLAMGVPVTASLGLSTTYITASAGVKTTFITASAGVSASFFELPPDGALRSRTSSDVKINLVSLDANNVLRIGFGGGVEPTAHVVHGGGSFGWYTGAYNFLSTTSVFDVGVPLFTAIGAKFSGAVTASLGVSGSHISLGTAPATDGLVRFTAPLASTTHFLRFNQPGSGDFDLLKIETGPGVVTLGNATGHNTYIKGYAVDIGAGAGNFVTITSNGTEAARFTNALNTIPLRTLFTGPVSASLGLSASFLQIGTATVASTGSIRAAAGFNIKYSVSGSDRPLIEATTGSEVFIGGSSTNDCAAIYQRAGQNGVLYSQIAGVTYLTISANATTFGTSRTVFTGPVTASLGISSSFYSLNGSGNNKPSTGMLRIPYNMGSVNKVITAKYSDDSTDVDFLQYGTGNTWIIGNTTQNTYINAYSIQTVAQTGGQAHYYNGTWDMYNYARSAYDVQIAATGATFNIPITCSLGLSSSYGQLSNTGFNLYVKPGGKATDKTTIGHRLTLSASAPYYSASVISASTVYLTPYNSNQIALFNNVDWYLYEVNEIALSLTSSLTINNNYDVFATPDTNHPSGAAIVLGPAWTNNTVRNTALARRDGVLVLSSSHSRRYVGTIRTTSATTTEDSESKRLVYNFYNRMERFAYVEDRTASWAYSGAAWRQVRATTTNKVEAVFGQNSPVNGSTFLMWNGASGTGVAFYTNMGIDSTTRPDGQVTTMLQPTLAAQSWWPSSSVLDAVVNEGYHVFNWLEYAHATGLTGMGLVGFSQSHLRIRFMG